MSHTTLIPHATTPAKAKPLFESTFKADLPVAKYKVAWRATLDAAKALCKKLEEDTSAPTKDNFLVPLDRLCMSIGEDLQFPFQRCHPEKAMREEADEADKECSQFLQALYQSPALLERAMEVDTAGFSKVDQRFLDHLLRDLKRAGAGLPAKTRDEILKLQDRLTKLTQDFQRNIDSGTKEIFFTKDELKGVTDDFWATHPLDAETGKYRITTDYPDRETIFGFCEVRATRKALHLLVAEMCYPDNEPILTEILELKLKIATLRGYENGAALALETQMMKSPAAAVEFLNGIKDKCWDLAKEEMKVLQAEMVALGQVAEGEELRGYDVNFARKKYSKKLSGYDVKDMRQYFPAKATIEGVFKLAEDLFSIKFIPVDVPGWHEDVEVRDIVEQSAPTKPIGRIYMDMFPRPNKYSHACMSMLRQGVTGLALPEVTLIANVAGGKGAFSSFNEAETLFHELGHGLHGIFGGQNQTYADFCGTAVETDFVEAPSQMLEEFLLTDATRSFAKNDKGEPLPKEMLEAIRRNNLFGNAIDWQRQAFLAKICLDFYTKPLFGSLFDMYNDAAKDWMPWPLEPNTYPLLTFGHVPTYGPCYYAYILSKVVCRDLLKGFDGNFFDKAKAQRYREKILAPGGSMDAHDMIASFLGRPLSHDAFAEWLASSIKA